MLMHLSHTCVCVSVLSGPTRRRATRLRQRKRRGMSEPLPRHPAPLSWAPSLCPALSPKPYTGRADRTPGRTKTTAHRPQTRPRRPAPTAATARSKRDGEFNISSDIVLHSVDRNTISIHLVGFGFWVPGLTELTSTLNCLSHLKLWKSICIYVMCWLSHDQRMETIVKQNGAQVNAVSDK